MTARLLTIATRDAASAPGPELDQAQEAAHLRRVLETQPSCLMRVAVDGQLLAANEAALALLGAQELSDVVGNSLTERMAAHHATEWHDFAERVWAGAPGSIECAIMTVSGALRSVLFQAVPLNGHPDEVRSLLLAARDMSANRRLETALEHHDATGTVQDLRADLDQARAELEALRAERRPGEPSSAEHAANQQQMAAQLASEVVRLKQALVEDQQLAALLTSRADAARAEQQRTAVLLEQRAAEYERLVVERTAERARLQQEIADEHERARKFEREARGFDAVRAQAAVTHAETADLRTSLERRDAEYQRLVTEQATERAGLQQAVAAERELAQGLERRVKEFADVQLRLEVALDAAVADTADLKALQSEAQSVVKDLRSKLVNAAAERTRLDTLLKQRDASEQQSAEQREAERANVERAREEAVRKHAAIVKALADQKLELEILTENIRSVEPLAAAGRLAAEVHEELLAFLAQIEKRAQSLIERSALEATDRNEIEELRIETARAALLARQVVSPRTVA